MAGSGKYRFAFPADDPPDSDRTRQLFNEKQDMRVQLDMVKADLQEAQKAKYGMASSSTAAPGMQSMQTPGLNIYGMYGLPGQHQGASLPVAHAAPALIAPTLHASMRPGMTPNSAAP